MGRRILLLALVGVMMTACGSGDTVGSTTSTSTTSSTTATTVATTADTQVEACEPTPLEGRPRIWEEGCVYTANSFAVPVTFTAPGAGWTSHGAADRWVELRHDADRDGSFDVSLTLIAHEAESTTADVIDAIVLIDGVDLMNGPLATVIQSSQALTVDLLGRELPNSAADGQTEPCTRAAGTAFFFTDGYGLFRDPDRVTNAFVGVPACFTTRAWIIDVSGTSITALGVAKDNDRFEELMPILEDFLEHSVMFGDDDG